MGRKENQTAFEERVWRLQFAIGAALNIDLQHQSAEQIAAEYGND